MSKNSVKNNTIFNTIKSVLSVVYPLITFPYTTRVLMTENVGKIGFGSSIVSYFTLIASLGISTYAVRECARLREDKAALEETASQIFSINIVSTAVSYFALLVTFLFARKLDEYRLLICIQSSVILFSTLGAEWINTAMEDFRFIAIRTMIMQAVSLALMFIFVRRPEDYIKYAMISVLSSSGAHIANILYRRRFCRIRFTLSMGMKKHLRSIVLMFSLILSQTIYVNSDMTILGLIKGDYETGLYSTAVRIYTIVNTTIASISLVVLPKLSYYFAGKDYKEIGKLMKYSLNFILVLGLPCIFGLEVIGPQIIVFMAGEAYAGAGLALRILSAAMLCSFIGGWIGNNSFIPAGREDLSLKISVVSALINIVLNFILIPKWGLYAAAFTTFLSELFGMICGFVFMDKNIRIEGLRSMLTGPLIGCAGILAIGIAAQLLLTEAWLITLVTVALSVIWYIAVMVVSKNEFFMGFAEMAVSKIKKRGEQ